VIFDIIAGTNTASVFDWTPAKLFLSGEKGAWYDPSDLTTMFQDIAGTIAVTADGQTVGKILDKSGNGKHATAPTDSARPLYKTDGTLHWLKFDGVNDNLSTANIDLSTTNKLSGFVGLLHPLSGGFYQGLYGNGAANTSGTQGKFCTYYTAEGLNVSRSDLGGSTASLQAQSPALVGPHIRTMLIDALVSNVKVRTDGVQAIENTGSIGGTNFSNAPLYICNTTALGGSSWSAPNIYSFFIVDRIPTTQEIADAERWGAIKSGVTLP